MSENVFKGTSFNLCNKMYREVFNNADTGLGFSFVLRRNLLSNVDCDFLDLLYGYQEHYYLGNTYMVFCCNTIGVSNDLVRVVKQILYYDGCFVLSG